MFQPQPQLCGMPVAAQQQLPGVFDDLSAWFAVPKQKISHSKKRLKQAHKNVMRHKENISTCPRTGEVTLKHKLPLNWKDYIPTFEYEPEPKA
jgi:ribosomal protein L32